jgi:adenylyltransferase/sulfurtransferase
LRDYSRLAKTAFARSRLRRLRIVVVGAGALGNEVLKNLALLGVGEIVVVDHDRVDASNLTRSILFCTPDIATDIAGRTPKAVLVSRALARINADVAVRPLVAEVADVGLGWFRRADVVFGCLDNELARLELGWACQRVDRPLVDGGLGWSNSSAGQVTLFPGARGPCYACRKGPSRRRELLLELQGRADPCWLKERAAGDGVATTPLTASTVAAFQVEIGLRACLDGVDEPSQGKAVRVTLHPAPSVAVDHFVQSASCPLHDPAARIESPLLQVERASGDLTLSELLDAAGSPDGTVVVDWPMTIRARCAECGHEWTPALRRARFRRQAACPVCLDRHVVELETIVGLDRASPWADHSLAALGLPSGHVYAIASAAPGGPFRHVEVRDDLPPPEGPS